ncbi:hypothetical protein PC116_g10427 [Phytophthora cactorum]|nr:hypothetical protein PC119_g7149 [Phytophthora cactorum]KAG4038321.1 hypothetical protein PC123_g26115 [Phytophthora cactorum]KAG4241663.1 hypothetical protein PC116_g10427 [Phytophthora cactorum]
MGHVAILSLLTAPSSSADASPARLVAHLAPAVLSPPADGNSLSIDPSSAVSSSSTVAARSDFAPY